VVIREKKYDKAKRKREKYQRKKKKRKWEVKG
jgi:Zn-finger nucleic acid-binding protein